MFKDYYAALGVSPNASAEQIRKAYKRMALLSHPDRASGLSDTMNNTSNNNTNNSSTLHDQTGVPLGGTGASSLDFGGTTTSGYHSSFDASHIPAFTEIKEAYDVLSDVARRYLYDLSYQQAVEQHRQLQLEAQRRQQERERMQQEREIELAFRREREMALAREREIQERQRREQQERERAAAAAAVPAPPSGTEASAAGPNASRNSRNANANAPPPPLVPHSTMTDTTFATPTRPPRGKPKMTTTGDPRSGIHMKEANQDEEGARRQRGARQRGIPMRETAAPPSSSGSSDAGSNSSGTSTRLPNVKKANTINFSVDMLDTTKPPPPRKPCGYPLPPPEELGLPPDHFQKRAVRKAVHLFFSDVMPLVNMENDDLA